MIVTHLRIALRGDDLLCTNASAGGGTVRVGAEGPEVGATLVAKRDAADADPLFAPLPYGVATRPRWSSCRAGDRRPASGRRSGRW